MKSPFSAAYGFAVLILIEASIPGYKLDSLRNWTDNPILLFLMSDPFMHFFTCAILTFLIAYGYYKSRSTALPFLRIAFTGAGFGFLIEILHLFLPHRFFGWDDIFLNTMGALFAVSTTMLLVRYWLTPYAGHTRSGSNA